jgi:hypothetical protein
MKREMVKKKKLAVVKEKVVKFKTVGSVRRRKQVSRIEFELFWLWWRAGIRDGPIEESSTNALCELFGRAIIASPF